MAKRRSHLDSWDPVERRGRSRRQRYEALGFTLSFVGHGAVALIALSGMLYEPPPTGELPVYSVTMERARSLGGRMQVGKDDTKQPVAPPKNIAEESKKSEEKTPPPPPTAAPVETKAPEVKPEPKPEPKKEEPKPEEVKPEEAEIPLPEPTKKPEPTKAPTAAPTTAPTAAPTAPPAKTAAPAATPKPTKKEEQKKDEAKKEAKGKGKQEDRYKDSDYQQAMQRYLGHSSDAGGSGFGGAALGGQGMGGGIVKPREFFIYMQLLKDRVKQGWRWFDSRATLVAEVEIAIAPSGTIDNQRIIRSSGNNEFDQSVLRAVRAANPLPPPPQNVYADFRLVRILFDPREF